MRNLLITRRTVPLDRLEEYAEAWAAVAGAAAAQGGRAWLFRGAGHEDRFIEFVEWTGAPEFLAAPALVAACRELDACAAATESGAWEEATLP